MTQWYVKDLSQLTHVSVQTLHHYDRIGLLKPSVRLANGYRVYSENDLLKLQQIIALKFFGFELSQIKHLLLANTEVLEHFSAQAHCLEEKAKSLFNASQELKNIITDCKHNKSIPWETIIKSIEVYRMTQQLEKTWAGKVFNTEELKDFVSFEKSLNARFSLQELQTIEQQWQDLTDEVSKNLDKDPSSSLGIAFGKRCMDWVNHFYGKEYIHLRNAVWEKGFKKGQAIGDEQLPTEVVAWLDKAVEFYYRDQITSLFKQIGTLSDDVLAKKWNDILFDMYGNNQQEKNELINHIVSEKETSDRVKKWLKEVS